MQVCPGYQLLQYWSELIFEDYLQALVNLNRLLLQTRLSLPVEDRTGLLPSSNNLICRVLFLRLKTFVVDFIPCCFAAVLKKGRPAGR